MSYYSEKEYRAKDKDDIWFETLYFNRWFSNIRGPILDIGCATGNFIAVRPDQIEGIDIDEDSLEIARRKGYKVEKMNAEGGLWKIASGCYQGVYAKHVIEHLNDPLLFIKEVKRILAPGGKAIISTPNCPYMLNRAFWDDYTHMRPFTKKSLAMLAYDAGFRNFKVYEDFRCLPGLGKLIRIFNLSPDKIGKFQRSLGIKGLSLILELNN